jgi:hypothetical protein
MDGVDGRPDSHTSSVGDTACADDLSTTSTSLREDKVLVVSANVPTFGPTFVPLAITAS